MEHRTGSRRRALRSQAAFSLVELTVVIALGAIVAGMVTGFIARPMQGYRDVTVRATLVDVAETALRRMSRDVHAALPNSLRVSVDGRSLELLHTVDGARYRRGPGDDGSGTPHGLPEDRLEFVADAEFNVLGRFANLAFSYGTPLPAGTRLAVYTTGGAVWTDAATSPDPATITPAATRITITADGDEDHVTLSAPHRFRFESPRQRLSVVDGPVSYRCDLAAGTLTRYSGYAAASAQPTDPALPPLDTAAAARAADRLSDCRFTYDPGTPSRAGLVTIRLEVTEGDERVRLLHQVHVENSP